MIKFNLSFLFFLISISLYAQGIIDKEGAMVRSDTSQNNIYLCFTGHDHVEGFEHVMSVLNRQKVKGSFFFIGDFVRNYEDLVKEIAKNGHYVGTHSYKHLLYCDWNYRDSLLHSENDIKEDIVQNLRALKKIGFFSKYFMPPYEWYNQKVVGIASQLDQITVNFSPGTRSNVDHTTPSMPNYISSNDILESIYNYESLNGMNGFHLLIHPGTSPKRKDKLYLQLDMLISNLKEKNINSRSFD